MKTVHLISGLPCSGKTTYSKKLSDQTGGVHFWLDYWLITLYGDYDIDEIGHPEHVRRVLACREMIWSQAKEFLQRDIDVILDDGFFLREHRHHYIQLASKVGAHVKVHHLNTPIETLRVRLEARTANLPQYNFPISADRLDHFVEMYEVPSPDEGAELVVVDGR